MVYIVGFGESCIIYQLNIHCPVGAIHYPNFSSPKLCKSKFTRSKLSYHIGLCLH